MASLPLASERAQHPSSVLLLCSSPGQGHCFPQSLWCAGTVFTESPQILEVQMREPAWQVFHCPGTWIPSNLISPVSLHWSFSCYPLCSLLPSNPWLCWTACSEASQCQSDISGSGATAEKQQLKKSTSEYSAFQQFFLPTVLCHES